MQLARRGRTKCLPPGDGSEINAMDERSQGGWRTAASLSLVDRRLAYGVFRLTLGVNILIHGVSRIFEPGGGQFAAQTASEFVGTPLPQGLVHVFLIVLPYMEAIVGAFITLGLSTRWALTLGGLLMTALVFGTALRDDWSTVGIQMIYSITYFLLLANRADNHFSLDTLLQQNRRHEEEA